MSMILNGDGTITGLSAGGLPDSSVTTAELANGAVTAAKLASGAAATNLGLTTWTITESGGVLYFAVSGVNKAKLDSSGNLTVVGNVTAYGTV